MTLRLTFGIDPGLSGAIATLIDGDAGPVLDMPRMESGEVDVVALTAWIRCVRSQHAGAWVSACLEVARAMPVEGRKQGGQSMFNFGDSFGQAKAAFRVMGIPLTLVESSRWKRSMGLWGTEKDAARLLAIRRFPSAAHELQRKKDSGRSDALLIALWLENNASPGWIAA